MAVQSKGRLAAEGVFNVLLLAFSAAMFRYSFLIKGLSSATDKAGPSLMPKLIFGAMTVLSLILCAGFVSRWRRWSAQEGSAAAGKSGTMLYRCAVSIGGIAFFVAAVNRLGFLLSSLIYLFGEIALLAPANKRRPLLWAVLAVVFCAVVYYVFRYQVHVKLPKGILG